MMVNIIKGERKTTGGVSRGVNGDGTVPRGKEGAPKDTKGSLQNSLKQQKEDLREDSRHGWIARGPKKVENGCKGQESGLEGMAGRSGGQILQDRIECVVRGKTWKESRRGKKKPHGNG